MQDFEKLASFYLGRLRASGKDETTEAPLLYDARDLTTHAVCVGMTGSGKTGLCLALLEEAALDGIPAIAIDPKGDLGNLLLTFPELRPEDFAPWIDPGEAARAGATAEAQAARVAETWRKGLAAWGQDGERIARFRAAVDLAIYTPGSSAGLPLSVLRSFAAPSKALLEDADGLRDRIASAVSGLLALLGIDADPIRSREHILLSNLLEHAWRAGRDLEIASLIREIQTPPFEKVGVLDLESVFPAKDRFALSMQLNNLLASPGFAAWMEGEPLDVARLLWTPEGKPRLTILSIAHLSDAERMFFVTLLLNEVVSWVRGQAGTPSLRALLYMDEVFGYFPPTANPPSKTPMLTLLKQARAYGLGVVLATQNPVDLDYKGLANAGTWFLGRMQTERDKARVIEGLEGASQAGGGAFDRQAIEATLAGLRSRVFLMNNVHEDAPVLFESRWALSYLRGPLTRAQIQTLMADRKEAAAPPSAPQAAAAAPAAGASPERPVVPPDVPVGFLPWRGASAEGIVYQPALLATARVHYVEKKSGVDQWEEVTLLAPLGEESGKDPWEQAGALPAGAPGIEKEGAAGARYAPLPSGAAQAKQFARYGKALKANLYRARVLTLWECPALKAGSNPGESEGDFRVRLVQAAREKRDAEVEALREKMAAKAAALEERVRRAQERVAREASQHSQQKMQTVISLGATLLGALMGRKSVSATSLGRATTTLRGMGRSAREKEDVARAEERVEDLQREMAELDRAMKEEIAAMGAAPVPEGFVLEAREIRPRKSDIEMGAVTLVWTPWRAGSGGALEPAWG